MNLRFTENEDVFRQEIRDFLNKELPPNWTGLAEDFHDADERWAFSKAFLRKMAAKGWLQVNWPKEYGGLAATPMQMAIFAEEGGYHLSPFLPSSGWIGPAIIAHGTEAQKKRYLPGLAAGETELCIGYSEPGAGSDLFSLKTKAEERDDCYIVNGQKIFTSLAHRADYCWLAARTDPNLPKHKGISIFMVDMKTPGITVRPLLDMAHKHTFNEVFFDNVRVPKDCMIGKKNGGLAPIITELDIERAGGGGVDTAARCKRFLEDSVKYAKETKRLGKPLSKDPIVRQALAERAVEIETLRLLAYRVAWQLAKGAAVNYEASVCKVYGSEMQYRLAETGGRLLGLHSELEHSKWSHLPDEMWYVCINAITWIIGGGTNEIQRNMIATLGLGLPRN
jgi:3-oxocholest-4-en-26-oyl-CoA dehydrogenase alpha subunit